MGEQRSLLQEAVQLMPLGIRPNIYSLEGVYQPKNEGLALLQYPEWPGAALLVWNRVVYGDSPITVELGARDGHGVISAEVYFSEDLGEQDREIHRNLLMELIRVCKANKIAKVGVAAEYAEYMTELEGELGTIEVKICHPQDLFALD